MSLTTIDFDKLALKPGDKVLDLGCGEGRHAITAYLLADVHVTGLDLSEDDLTTARTRLSEFGGETSATKSCTFAKASGLAIPFPDDHFDKVICAEVLEHVPEYQGMLAEIKRVLKPGGLFAVSVPRYFPERICWWLSDGYHEVPGGHVRIFTTNQLDRAVTGTAMRRFARHWAHALHVPYWWLKCLFWDRGDDHPLVRGYHRFLVWDLMQAPWLTRTLERILNPLMGKSVVMYYVNET